MMKRFTNNRQVAQAFAEGATKGGTKHLFIEGPAIFSYGHHFPVAKREGIDVLLNTSKYSMTTSHHQGLVSAAMASHGIRTIPMSNDELKKRLQE
jgi:hypothetical protein